MSVTGDDSPATGETWSRGDMETDTIKRTGVIGLGAMGLQMARHMVRKGFDVAGYDVDVDAMRRAVEQGVGANAWRAGPE